MRFEYDEKKSLSNKLKHGMDFAGAQRVLDGPHLELRSGRVTGEMRWLLMGPIDGRLWTVVFTKREQIVRIISARRSRRDEEEAYQNEKGKNDRS